MVVVVVVVVVVEVVVAVVEAMAVERGTGGTLLLSSCFTSTETVRLIKNRGRPGQEKRARAHLPVHAHSSWAVAEEGRDRPSHFS